MIDNGLFIMTKQRNRLTNFQVALILYSYAMLVRWFCRAVQCAEILLFDFFSIMMMCLKLVNFICYAICGVYGCFHTPIPVICIPTHKVHSADGCSGMRP